jgi:hypothetical protein
MFLWTIGTAIFVSGVSWATVKMTQKSFENRLDERDARSAKRDEIIEDIREKLSDLDKRTERCPSGDIITEAQCARVQSQIIGRMDLLITHLNENQTSMKADFNQYQIQLSAAVGRLEHLAGRIENERK